MIKNKKVSELINYEFNNKKHPDKQIDLLANAIKEFGFDSPIIIDSNNIIIAGHGRLQAAKKLGLEEVPTIVKDKLTDAQIRKYRLLDNKIAELAEDNLEAIKFELEELEDPELNELYDLDIQTLDPDKEAIEDDVPEVQEEIIVEKGDIFQLGEHRLMCGDSTSIDDVEKLMDGEKADMVFTDPPYGVSYTGGVMHCNEINKNHKREMLKNDEIDIYNSTIEIISLFLKGPFYIFYATRNSFEIVSPLKNLGLDIMAIIAWVKINTGYADMNSHYKNKYEPCIYGKVGDNAKFIGNTTENTVWEIEKDRVNKLHPTQKPIAVPERAIRNHNADKILDLFGGSGSTLIASEKTNRKCYMMELDEKYIQVILKRYKDYTNGEKEIKCVNRELDLSLILD